MIDRIKDALTKLDPANDDHWTATGLPAMKAVEAIVGDASITRADVEAVWPGFCRPAQQPAPDDAALMNRIPTVALARAALSAFDAHFGAGPIFGEADAAVAKRPDIAPAAFWGDWLRRNAPAESVRRAYPMLSQAEKARIDIFLALAG